MFGICVYYAVKEHKEKNFIIFVALILFARFWFNNLNGRLDCTIVASLLLAAGARTQSKGRLSRIIHVLSKYTFALYLCHPVVWYISTFYRDQFFDSVFYGAFLILASVVLTYILHHLIEIPAEKVSKRLCQHIARKQERVSEKGVKPTMRKKLAIISSYNESCGNASYTEVLRREFSKYYDVEVLPLPQFLLKSPFQEVIKKGNKYIDDLAKQLKEFDYVNIQFEAGLFGNTQKIIFNRVTKLIKESKNLIVTMHRVDMPRSFFDKSLLKLILKFKFFEAVKYYRNNKFYNLYRDIVKLLDKKNKRAEGHAAIIVHTKREKTNIQEVFDFQEVYDFPITFLNQEQRKHQRTAGEREQFIKRYGFDASDKIIGLFGFVSEYKGFDTVLKALKYLPPNYKVAFFGRQHPMSIVDNMPVDPYISRLISEIESKSVDLKSQLAILSEGAVSEEDDGALEEYGKKGRGEKSGINTNEKRIVEISEELIGSSLDKRVFFKGELSDDDFISALYSCDFVVVPYMETNQSGSGVASLVVETKARSIFSNAHSFTQLKMYYPDCFESFDIGNYFELADRIKHYSFDFSKAIEKCMKTYNLENNVKLHMSIFKRADDKGAKIINEEADGI